MTSPRSATQPQAPETFYRALQRLQLIAVTAGRRAWSRMGADFDRSWSRVAPDLVAATTAIQLAAARTATEYVPAVLEETGQPNRPEARVRPQAFAGVAADGRGLPGLLYGAVGRAKQASRSVDLPPSVALDTGGRWLDALLQTAVEDAGRLATAAEIATRDNMGWVRVINPPCCGRCAILAGNWYRWSDGFKRHPRCDCFHIPAAEDVAGNFTTDPAALFDSGQVHGLSRRERERLAAGEDPVAVINESRDMWRARIQDQRRAEKDAAQGATPGTRDRQARRGLEDLFASTRSRTEALQQMSAQGFTT